MNGTAVTTATVFPIGTTTVTFAFTDASGNTGTAASTVTVSVGAPRITLNKVGNGTLQGKEQYVDLLVKNVGTGIARHATMVVAAVTTRGSGSPTVRTPQPISAGDLNPGESRVVRIQITVPASVKELVLIEVFGDLHIIKP